MNRNNSSNIIYKKLFMLEKKVSQLSESNTDNLFKLPINSIDNDELKNEILSESKLELNILDNKISLGINNLDKMIKSVNSKSEQTDSMIKTIITRMTKNNNELFLKIEKVNNFSKDELTDDIRSELLIEFKKSLTTLKNDINSFDKKNELGKHF